MKALNLEKVKAAKVYKCRSGTGYFECFFIRATSERQMEVRWRSLD